MPAYRVGEVNGYGLDEAAAVADAVTKARKIEREAA